MRPALVLLSLAVVAGYLWCRRLLLDADLDLLDADTPETDEHTATVPMTWPPNGTTYLYNPVTGVTVSAN